MCWFFALPFGLRCRDLERGRDGAGAAGALSLTFPSPPRAAEPPPPALPPAASGAHAPLWKTTGSPGPCERGGGRRGPRGRAGRCGAGPRGRGGAGGERRCRRAACEGGTASGSRAGREGGKQGGREGGREAPAGGRALRERGGAEAPAPPTSLFGPGGTGGAPWARQEKKTPHSIW